jgi:OOP family OmpA-OmpF porin
MIPIMKRLEKLSALASRSSEPIVCERGDADKDGVCDDWDRELRYTNWS